MPAYSEIQAAAGETPDPEPRSARAPPIFQWNTLMAHPDFFDTVRKIVVHDPLADILGAAEGGLIEYSYADAVKLAGHSCPTVAGAYIMTLTALAHLYGDRLPERGGVALEFRAPQDSGVTGVIANVAGLITGAAGEGGFKGLGGRHGRRNLVSFDASDVEGDVRFRRLDTQACVSSAYHPEIVPADPEVMRLLPALFGANTDTATRRSFARGWQDRVRRIFEHIDDPALVTFA